MSTDQTMIYLNANKSSFMIVITFTHLLHIPKRWELSQSHNLVSVSPQILRDIMQTNTWITVNNTSALLRDPLILLSCNPGPVIETDVQLLLMPIMRAPNTVQCNPGSETCIIWPNKNSSRQVEINVKCCHVSIHSSFCLQGGLSRQVVFNTGFTVFHWCLGKNLQKTSNLFVSLG